MLGSMISLIQTLPIGNALRVHLSPPDGAARWRLLRNQTGEFTGHDDATAKLILDDDRERVVLDRYDLANETAYFYCLYSLVGGVWSASPVVGAVPQASLEGGGTDVQALVRERLEMGLQEDVNRGLLSHDYRRIPVLTAPPVFEDTSWPVVVIHMQNDTPAEHGVGMVLNPDRASPDGLMTDEEGYLSSVHLTIAGWTLNPDERIALRKAIKRVIMGNIPVFDDAGMVNVDVQFSDIEDFNSYSAPVYQAVCQLSCLAPSVIGSTATDVLIDDVEVIAR